MNSDYATVAKCPASPARSAMVGRLLDGKAMTAGELARAAKVLPSTASEHLARLAAAGLVTSMYEGRRRYFSLATTETAEALEALAHICPRQSARSLAGVREDTALSLARLCYDHVAGKAGLAILDALLSAKWLQPEDGGFAATAKGTAGFGHLGIDIDSLRSRRLAFARGCMDWTERRPHLAGRSVRALPPRYLTRGGWNGARKDEGFASHRLAPLSSMRCSASSCQHCRPVADRT